MFKFKRKSRIKFYRADRPTMSRRSKANLINSSILVLMCAAIYAFYMVIQEYGVMQVKKIIADGSNVFVENSQVASHLEHLRGKYYLDLPSEESLAKRLLSHMPQLATARVEKRFPATVIIFYEEHKIAFRLQQDYNNPLYLVGWNGEVIAVADERDPAYQDLPVIHVPTQFIKVAREIPNQPQAESGSIADFSSTITQQAKSVFKTKFDVDIKQNDRTKEQDIDTIEIGVAIDETIVDKIEPEMEEVPQDKLIGDRVVDEDDIALIAEAHEAFLVKVLQSPKEIWYYDIEREIHVELENELRIKFSLEYPIADQVDNFMTTIDQFSEKQRQNMNVDLRVPGKVFTCKSASCF